MTAVQKLDKLPSQDRIENITIDVAGFEETADKLMEQVERAEIVDSESYARGGDLIKVTRTQQKKVEDIRKELVGPHNALVKFINDTFRGPKARFDDVRKAMEAKMLAWKKEEDRRRREEAEAERKRLEEEALERAAAEKESEDQDAVLEAASAAAEEVEDRSKVGLERGTYGSTGTTKKYSTNVTDLKTFLLELPSLIRELDDEIALEQIVELKKSGLNRLAAKMRAKGIEQSKGATYAEEDSLRIY